MKAKHAGGNENNPTGKTILIVGATLLVEVGEVINNKAALLCELELPPFKINPNREQLTSTISTFTHYKDRLQQYSRLDIGEFRIFWNNIFKRSAKIFQRLQRRRR